VITFFLLSMIFFQWLEVSLCSRRKVSSLFNVWVFARMIEGLRRYLIYSNISNILQTELMKLSLSTIHFYLFSNYHWIFFIRMFKFITTSFVFSVIVSASEIVLLISSIHWSLDSNLPTMSKNFSAIYLVSYPLRHSIAFSMYFCLIRGISSSILG